MIAVLNYIVIFILAWLLFKKNAPQQPRLFWMAFSYHLLLAMALGLIYRYYYSANDTWLFFQDSNTLAQFGENDFMGYCKFLFSGEAPSGLLGQLVYSQERSVFLVKIMSVFSWMGGHNYWASAAWFSFISFLSCWYLYAAVAHIFERSHMAASLSFLFFPSVAFWGSGLVKETIALAGIYFLAGIFLKFIHRQKTKWFEWALLLGSYWAAWNLKYYWATLFAAVLLTYAMVIFLGKKFSVCNKHKVFTWLIVFIFLCGGASLSHPNFYPSRFLEVLVSNHEEFIRISDDSGLIHFYDFHASWWSVVLNAPWALFSGLLRPFIWEASGMTAFMAALENLMIVVLLVSALGGYKKHNPHQLLFFSLLVYVAMLCVFLALSTPNFGTLSRYRVGFLPFFVFVITYRNPLVEYLSERFKFLRVYCKMSHI